MIMDSYSACCYIENNGGQYHMECEMTYDDKEAYADYDGESFVDGLNEIMDDITAQMSEEPEPEPEETSEEKIARLEKIIAELKAENDSLKVTPKKKETDFHIDEAIKNFNNALDSYYKNYENNFSKLDKLCWPFKVTTREL
jgi:hypothetical protein